MKDLQFLIVEDHQFQRRMLEQALRLLGAEKIVAAGNGAEAMRVLRATPVDVVITDLMMPDVDGIELIPLLREHARTASVVFFSSDEASLLTAAAIAKAHGLKLLGAVGKPVTPDKLRTLLESHVPG